MLQQPHQSMSHRSRSLPLGLITACAVLLTTATISPPAAAADYSWGWQKPLNQRPGSLLYTTNRYAKRRTANARGIFGSPTYRSPTTYRSPAFRTPVYRPTQPTNRPNWRLFRRR